MVLESAPAMPDNVAVALVDLDEIVVDFAPFAPAAAVILFDVFATATVDAADAVVAFFAGCFLSKLLSDELSWVKSSNATRDPPLLVLW